jgi:hypothetical protein
MQIITILPPLVERNVRAADECESIVVNLSIQWRQGLVDLGCREKNAVSMRAYALHGGNHSAKSVLTLLCDQLNLRNEADIGRGCHGMCEQQAAVLD